VRNPTDTRVSILLNKVPEVTVAFWVIKIMSTTVGETGADYLPVHVGLGTVVTDAVMACLLGAVLFLQMRAHRYVPWVYWLTVVLVSIVGTQITDALTNGLGISLYVSTAVFAALLAATFAVWYAIERTLSIHTSSSRRAVSSSIGWRSCSPSRWAPPPAILRPRRSALGLSSAL
jgi:uncharacterized membrane-anchored protein